jgi:MIP family channel proteins
MDIVRRLVAEFIGTFAIVFVGIGAISVGAQGKGNLLSIALAFGFVVAVMVSATLHISGGQFNPAVSLALFVTRKMSARDTLFYILIQMLGATCGALVLAALFGTPAVAAGTPVVTQRPAAEVQAGTGEPPAPDASTPTYLTPVQGLAVEAILTFLLVFVIFGVAVDKRGPNALAGLLIGLTVTLDILFGGPFTGASMNPARSFGPAIVSGIWTNHWIYWVGPVVGGAIAAMLYNSAFLAPVRTVAAAATRPATPAAAAVPAAE